MLGIFKSIIGLGAKAAEKILPAKTDGEQTRLNEEEIKGAPASPLRLWRSFLGYALAISFVWEVLVRPFLAAYFPTLPLPASYIKETISLLAGMLGLGL